ncbi:hypothetical protein BU23DRAFT_570610 [Bimuria novae-zelandiae CBS 107.79]|uniref:Uncharacterized protein n=1 Tax=Bimuria novae-zelandiae CBS 107.79 TaxID=1447943 RepID=A0A6A5VBT3_9PLEO|nr:hypothetical protein BU23DRAFT_570610 [Bimuria novae-zelandiae CBS 107.79]
MKLAALLVALTTILPAFEAHWIFSVISVNSGARSNAWQYVRKLGPGPPPYSDPDPLVRGWPHQDVFSDEIRCGRGAFASAKTTEILLLQAGDEVSFFPQPNYEGDFDGRENVSAHVLEPLRTRGKARVVATNEVLGH